MFKIFVTQKFLGLKISEFFETSLKIFFNFLEKFLKFFRPKHFLTRFLLTRFIFSNRCLLDLFLVTVAC